MAVALGAVLWGSGACRPRTRVVRCHYGFQGPILTDQPLKSETALVDAMSSLTSQASRLYWVINKVISPRTRRLDGTSTGVRWKLFFLMLHLIYRENGTMRMTFMNRAVFCCIVMETLLSRQSPFAVPTETLHLPASTIQVCYFMSSILSYIFTIFFRSCVDWSPDLRHLPCPFTQLPPLWSGPSVTLLSGVSDPCSTGWMWWAIALWSYLSGGNTREWGGQSWLLQKRCQELKEQQLLRNSWNSLSIS